MEGIIKVLELFAYMLLRVPVLSADVLAEASNKQRQAANTRISKRKYLPTGGPDRPQSPGASTCLKGHPLI